MRIISSIVVATALALTSGCARSDWIQQTLVTADVTGTWQSTGDIFIVLTLEQLGQKVTGFVVRPKYLSGALDGTVTGDEVKFQKKTGSFEAKMTVSGDEMSGTLRAITYSAGPGYARGAAVHFRRVSSLPSPDSEEK
jgi:hypothetical protein